jgi:hypothetical protein
MCEFAIGLMIGCLMGAFCGFQKGKQEVMARKLDEQETDK